MALRPSILALTALVASPGPGGPPADTARKLAIEVFICGGPEPARTARLAG